MKRFLLILLFMVFLVPFVHADRNVSTITTYKEGRYLIKTGDWKVYRVSFIATSNGGEFALFDSITYATSTITAVKIEGSEATALNGYPQDFTNKPIEGSTGLYLLVSSAIVIVEYE